MYMTLHAHVDIGKTTIVILIFLSSKDK